MLARLKSFFFGIRPHKRELEAVLRPLNGHAGRGEVEIARFADGAFAVEVNYKGVDADDGVRLEVIISGAHVGGVIVSRGCVFDWLSFGVTSEAPQARAGDVVELVASGEPVARGQFACQ